MAEETTLKQLLAEPSTIEDLHIPQNLVIDLIFGYFITKVMLHYLASQKS
jgi:hypothetical protein